MLLTFLMLVFGMTSPTPEPIIIDPPPPTPGAKEIKVGETVELGIGATNYSTRSYPMVIKEPDPAVVTVRKDSGPAPEGCNPGGCENPTWLEITGVAPGTTELTVQQCFVERKGHCRPQGEPRTYWIVVVE